ncbi:MAG TPA: hypothetical protein EYP85_02230 [Armatimonadetes bacterium]|nr:hypothetical protein [Armatimonadota bacterium]
MGRLTGWIKHRWREGIALCAVLCGVGVIAAVLSDRGTIAPRITLAGVEVGGLTPEAAEARVRAVLTQREPSTLTFVQGRKSWRLAGEKIGLAFQVEEAVEQAYAFTRSPRWHERWAAWWELLRRPRDFPVAVSYEEEKLRARLEEMARFLYRPPRNARLRLEGWKIHLVPDRPGYALDVEATLRWVRRQRQVPLPTAYPLIGKPLPAAVTISDLHGIDSVLASYTTDLARGYYGQVRENRTHNVRLLLQKINGTVVKPGEVFSFNETAGKRRGEDGYRPAPVFIRDKVVDNVGGGICQLATTLFNAALLANLDILTRSSHSQIVHYVPAGRDATVYYGLIDLKFRNSLPHPIVLWGTVENYQLTVYILGWARDKVEVELHRTPWWDERGHHVILTRVVRVKGRVVRRERVARSFYPRRPKPAPATEPTQVAQAPAVTSPPPEPSESSSQVAEEKPATMSVPPSVPIPPVSPGEPAATGPGLQ